MALSHPAARLLMTMLMLVASSAAASKLQVVVTIHPYFSLAQQIGGELVDASYLLPTGTSPHSYDPSARDVIRVAEADLVVRNGGVGLDEWVLRLISASGTDALDLSIMDSIEFTPLGTSASDGDQPASPVRDLGADAYYVNAHIWLDATIAMSAAEAIAEAMIELDPANEAHYEANLKSLLFSLEQLDQELLEMLEPIRGEPFIPFHDAWPYFANRYGLNLLLEIEPFPGREPSPEYLIYALGLIADNNVKAIFSERQLATRPAETVAAEAGLPLYLLDPEGGGSSDTESYQELMLYNARVLLEALGD